MSDDAIRAAGIAVARRTPDGALEFLLVQSRHTREWGIPKGHAERGESAEETARREVREETGLTQVDLAPGSTTVTYTLPHRSVRKRVVYFAGTVAPDAAVAIDPEECMAGAWFPLPAALDAVPHVQLRTVLSWAAERLGAA